MNIGRGFVLAGLLALSAQVQAQQGDYCYDPYRSHYRRGTELYWREQMAHWMLLNTRTRGELERAEQNRQLAAVRIRYPAAAGIAPNEIPRLPQVLARATAVWQYYAELNALSLFCLDRASQSEHYAAGHGDFFDAPPVRFRRPVPPLQR